jgi:thiol-disulfide isomerase/thioredoxin
MRPLLCVCVCGRAAESPGWLALPYTDSLKAKEAALARQFMARRSRASLQPNQCVRLANNTRSVTCLQPTPARVLSGARALTPPHAPQVKGVPALVMLAPDGTLINKGTPTRTTQHTHADTHTLRHFRSRAAIPLPLTRSARPLLPAAAARISDAAAFPWPPPSLAEALGPSFLNEHNERVSLSTLTSSGKYIALYFGAAWCGPCRAFARRLRETYATVVAEGGALEIIYVSSDHTPADAEAQRTGAPWLCVPFEERWRKDALWCVACCAAFLAS